MRILVTGGSGFIGTNLINKLNNFGYNTISFGKTLPDIPLKNTEYIEGNVLNSNDLYSVVPSKKIDCIFHLAAKTRPQLSILEPDMTLKTNIIGTLNILNLAKDYNIQVILAGSSSVHSGSYNSPYSFSKTVAEDLCKLYAILYNSNTVSVRLYNVYGNSNTKNKKSTVIDLFEEQFKSGAPLQIIGTGTQKCDFTHIDDVVNSLISCIGKTFSGEIFELGSGKVFSINEVAAMFGENYPKLYIKKNFAEYEPSISNFTKAEELIGWHSTIKLEDYIKSIISK